MLLGNKCDATDLRQVTTEEGSQVDFMDFVLVLLCLLFYPMLSAAICDQHFQLWFIHSIIFLRTPVYGLMFIYFQA